MLNQLKGASLDESVGATGCSPTRSAAQSPER
jgi:hypothetical protein